MASGITHPLVVITPVYEDSEAACLLFSELAAEFAGSIFVVAVDDGSVRQPLAILSLARAGLSGVIIKLKRNVGHQRAIAIGISYVAEHLPESTVVVMDSDGEDSPRTIKTLMQELQSANVHAAVAQRANRVETLRFRAFYHVYKLLFRLLTGRRISFGNFMVLKPAAIKRLASMQELWTHVASCVLISKLPLALCPLDRGRRYAGQSKMNFVDLTLHGLKGLMGFAEDVLVRVCITCAIVAALSIVASIAAVALKLAGFATPGWFSVALGILLLVFMQTGALTLMSLMLTGVVKGGKALEVQYTSYIAEILTTATLEPAARKEPEVALMS